MNKNIVLVGAGGHCKVIIDIIVSQGEYKIIGITDPFASERMLLGFPIIGNDEVLKNLFDKGVVNAFLCIGALNQPKQRTEIYNRLKKIGFSLPNLIHKNAYVSGFSTLGEGNCIMAKAVINAGVMIGDNCIINTSSVIEHDCVLQDNIHISPNASIAGRVSIGKNSHIGIGSTIIQNINIGSNVTIGAGAVVINDMEDNVLAVGVPAKIVKRNKRS